MSHPVPIIPQPRRRHALATPRRRAALGAALGALMLNACNLASPVTPATTLAAAAMVVASGGAQVGAAGNTLARPVVIRVTDRDGAPVIGAAVAFAPATSAGSVNAATILTDTSGSAGVLWTLGTGIGVDSLDVSVAGVPALTVTATVTPGFPDSVTVVSGAAQTAPAGSTLGIPLVVKVADQFGNVVPNASVSWSSDADGQFPSAGAVTDADGRVQAVYTLGAGAGVQHVTVVVSTEAGAVAATISETGS
jgi:hypothetical protein